MTSLMADTLVAALGGLEEIGLNALALEAEGGVLLVDCGLLVGGAGLPGVDYAVPDFAFLRERAPKLLGVVLTHGHDDHVGAVPHLLRELPVPVYGTPYTLELLDDRLRVVAPARRGPLRRVEVGGKGELGPFAFELLRVTHSVPDACAVALSTPGGNVLCTGDFKLDPTPVDGRPADEAGFRRWGERGVDLLCCDSTNASRPGSTLSEREVGRALRRLFPSVPGRIYFATFSSHVHRVQQVLEASREVGRAVAILGRGLAANLRSARRLGHLQAAPGDLVPELRAARLPRSGVTVVLAGAQGEPGSALRRVASGGLPRHRLAPGDAVILSSRAIPGNELAVGRLVDLCLEQGAAVHFGEESGVHVSGHPGAGDVLRLLDWVSPAHVLPVHGERRHREALAALARQWGLPEERVHLAGNGRSLLLRDGRVLGGPVVPVGRTCVEQGREWGEGDPLLRDRVRLGRRGVALASAAVTAGGSLAWGPRVTLRGVLPAALAEEESREAERALRRSLGELPLAGLSAAALEVELKTALRRHLRRRFPELPVVVAQVAEVDSGNGAPLQ